MGPGGSPDENGETTIDALVMNGVNTGRVFLSFDIVFALLTSKDDDSLSILPRI